MDNKYSWKLGDVAGIEIFIHGSFAILPVWVVFSTLAAGGGLAMAIYSVAFVLAVFGCVLLHELGHALMARQFNIGTRDITLLPIGGLARLERMPRRPFHELAVALAGPAVNVVIAMALSIGLMVASGPGSLYSSGLLGGSLLANLMWANVVLVVFNMLPAFPMDGGRVFRALLAVQLPRVRATRIASAVGQVLAIGLAVIGLFSNWMFILVGIFIFVAARGETEMVELEDSMTGALARDAMTERFRTVAVEARLSDIARVLCFDQQEEFPVVRGQSVVGMLSKQQLLRAMASGARDLCVEEVMHHQVPAVASDDRLTDCLGRFHAEGWHSAPVFHAGRLVGLLTHENLMRWLQVGSWAPRAS